MTLKLSLISRNSIGNVLNDLLDSGSRLPAAYMEIRTGKIPALPDNAPTGVVLVTISLPVGGFGTFTNATGIVPSIKADMAVLNDGTAGYFRLYNRDQITILDGTVGLTNTGADLTFDRIDFITGGSVAITNFVLTIPLTN